MESKKWTDITHHFHLDKFETEKIKSLFLNQVHGIPIGNKPICASIRNVVDGGMQNSEHRSDVFDPKVPMSSSHGDKNGLDFYTLMISIRSHSLQENIPQKWKSFKKKNKSSTQNQFKCGGHSQMLEQSFSISTQTDHSGFFFVITDTDNSPISKSMVSYHNSLKDKFLVLQLTFYLDPISVYQFFTSLSKHQ